MKPFLPLAFLLLLPSCGALALQGQNDKLDKVDRGLDVLSRSLGEVAATVEEVKQAKASSREQADVNKDGKLDPTEMLTYGGLLAAALAEMARRKMKALQGQIDHERAKRKEAEEEEMEALLEAQAKLEKLQKEGKLP